MDESAGCSLDANIGYSNRETLELQLARATATHANPLVTKSPDARVPSPRNLIATPMLHPFSSAD
jgi:hypothetical protein